MAHLLRAVPKTQQVCPMCGAQLPSGALYCEACGTDLSRTGVLFSSSIRPVSPKRWDRRRLVRTAALAGGALAALLVLLVGLGSVPTVSARVPAILAIVAPIRGAFSQAVEWGSQLVSMGRERPQAPPEAAPAPDPSLQPPPPPQPVTPYLVVKSAPAGAEVFMNAEYAGKTPLTLYNLRPGNYVIRVSLKGYPAVNRRLALQPNIGATVSVRLEPEGPKAQTSPPKTPPAPPSQGQAKRQPAPRSAQAGAPAPGFTLKDRLGVIYRLSDYRGRRLALLFIWDLDEEARRAVRALNTRVGARNALIVLLNPNRAAVRHFAETEHIAIPILFGSPELAWEYKVPEGVPVLFVISEGGQIESRQIAQRQ